MRALRLSVALRTGRRFVGAAPVASFDDPLPLETPEDDDHACSYQPRGTIRQIHVADERYHDMTCRPSAVGKTSHAIAGVNHGTNINRSRMHAFEPLTIGAVADQGFDNRQRMIDSFGHSWGFVMQHLLKMYGRLDKAASESTNPTGFAAFSMTASSRERTRRPEPMSMATMRRELEFEIARYMPALEETLDTTATSVLLSRFLKMHVDFAIDVRAPQPGEMRAAARIRHRALLRRVIKASAGAFQRDLDACDARIDRGEKGTVREHAVLLAALDDTVLCLDALESVIATGDDMQELAEAPVMIRTLAAKARALRIDQGFARPLAAAPALE